MINYNIRRFIVLSFRAVCLWGLCGSAIHPLHATSLRPQVGTTDSRTLLDIQAARQQGMDRGKTLQDQLPSKLLVLLVDFTDEPHAGNKTREVIAAEFFAETGSVREYYLKASYGGYSLEGSAANWVRLPQTQAFYANSQSGVGGTYPRNARRMVEDAVRAADAIVDFAQFDNDGPDGLPSSGDDDGYVDALMIVHAGEGAEQNGNRQRILSHNWFTQDPVITRDGPAVWIYSTVSETSPLGTPVHEFGHLLGLPDLYDRSAALLNASGGLGFWSVMGVGNWLGDGKTPGDFDAVSKILLGFVDPIVPQSNSDQLRLSVSRDGFPPDIYQVWTRGEIGSEFFVIENRRRQGLDVALPGSGMLVYKVDLQRGTNDDADQLRVALLQADGRRDLEEFQSSGDSGDPFPGTRGVSQINAQTQPSTRNRDDNETQVAITSISLPRAIMQFNLQIESKPHLRVISHGVRELEGDGDGIPEVGEVLELQLLLENAGLTSTAMNLTLQAERGQVAWILDRVTLPSLRKHETFTAAYSFLLQQLDDPDQGLPLRGTAIDNLGSVLILQPVLAIGESRGFAACLDGIDSRFNPPCTPNTDAWRSEALQGARGWSEVQVPGELRGAFRSSKDVPYADSIDVALISPRFNLDSGSQLSILHQFQTEDLDAGWAMDGGRVEISLDGTQWQTLQPVGGYPRRMFPESVQQFMGSGVFGGTQGRTWSFFDLGERQGSAQLRFRFASNESIGGSGWALFRVRVTAGNVKPDVSSLALRAEPNPARFPTRIAFRIQAPRQETAFKTRLRIFDVRGRRVRSLEHSAIPAQTGLFEWNGMDHAGFQVPSGVYFAQLQWGARTATTKVLVIE